MQQPKPAESGRHSWTRYWTPQPRIRATLLGRDWGNNPLAKLVPNPTPQWAYLTLELGDEPERLRDLLGWSPQIDAWLRLIQ